MISKHRSSLTRQPVTDDQASVIHHQNVVIADFTASIDDWNLVIDQQKTVTVQ